MPLTVGALAGVVDELAPFRLACDWDNVGLQIGDPAAEVSRVLLALEADAGAVAAAQRLACGAILTHHPLIFRPLRHLRLDSPQGRLVAQLLRADIALIAAHTNLDRVLHGTNGALASRLALRDVRVLEPAADHNWLKFTVFVPREYTPKIIEAIHRGGGGRIGKYTHCTFRSPGTGTYVPGDDANPFSGTRGRLEQADEDRLEAIVPRQALGALLHEVRQAHPYEEMAYDVYPLANTEPTHGFGAVGTLPSRTTLGRLASQLHEACGAETTAIIGSPGKPVRRVAIATGSGGSFVAQVLPTTADVLITGELGYHQACEARDRGLAVICLGHAASEKIFAGHFRDLLAAHPAVHAAGLKLEVYEDFPDPLQVVATSARSRRSRH
jgi:dinuclear metal center YbgI/SA1388 family protein